MSAQSDSNTQSKKRSFSPGQGSDSPLSKQPKVDEQLENDVVHESAACNDRVKGPAKDENGHLKDKTELPEETGREKQRTTVTSNSNEADSVKECAGRGGQEAQASFRNTEGGEKECRPSTSQERSDSAAIAAAEALASLTRGNDESEEMPCSSKQVGSVIEVSGGKARPSGSKERGTSERGQHTEAAAADSSSSLLSRTDREGAEQDNSMDDEEDSLPGSSSTPSSSLASDNEDNEDGECAIVSVKMAPEIRQSVALLAQVQMRLDALEKKGARLHQRLELKLGRQRRPHLDQRNAITQAIPGFWVTALLNHPHLSAHIDENDEDALSYMNNLEIESFKNNKLGYRIGFHFRRNPYFQNNVLVKELHLGMGGSPMSFSNPILWHRGQNLTGHAEPKRNTRGVYQSFFSWFGDHSNPCRDDIAQILKDDLFRNPLRYYLTPLWEPRENGSAPKVSDSSNRDECVVISDSDDEQEESSSNLRKEREEEDEEEEEEEEEDEEEECDDEEDHAAAGSDASESSDEEKEEEEVDVEEMEDSRGSRDRGTQEEEDIEVDEEEQA